jgi:hypothetical protein
MPLAVTNGSAGRAPVQAAVYLAARQDAIVTAAEEQLAARSPKYAEATTAVLHERLTTLYAKLTEALLSRSLLPLFDHAREVAAERFHGGYDLSEVQKAYNAVEEAIWSRVFADGRPERYAVVLPCVSASIGAAKDELAREYVRLASGAHAPTVDVTALFLGGGSDKRCSGQPRVRVTSSGASSAAG